MNQNGTILTLVTFLPLAGALLLLVFPRGERALKWGALAISVATFALSLLLAFSFDRNASGFQFKTDAPWIQTPNIHYHIGIDGISLWLVILTTLLVPVSVLIQWNSIHGRVKEFFCLFLVLETGMIGVFVALDLFLFYVFWEASLIPMALIIGMYGHERRVYAAVKFFLYTMIASMFMLAAIIWMYIQTGSFDYTTLRDAAVAGTLPHFNTAA